MSSGDTRTLIEQAIENVYAEVPALKQLKLVIRLELRSHGRRADLAGGGARPGDRRRTRPATRASTCPCPGPTSTSWRAEGSLRHWVDAYEHGHVRVSGDPAVTKLIGNVIQRQLART